MSLSHLTEDEAHPAMMPKWLARDLILSWSNRGDTILDPFAGSGTTARMALEEGRKTIAIEVNPDYAKLIRESTGNLTPRMALAAHDRLPPPLACEHDLVRLRHQERPARVAGRGRLARRREAGGRRFMSKPTLLSRLLCFISPKWREVQSGPVTSHLMFFDLKIGERHGSYRIEENRLGERRVFLFENGFEYEIHESELTRADSSPCPPRAEAKQEMEREKA